MNSPQPTYPPAQGHSPGGVHHHPQSVPPSQGHSPQPYPPDVSQSPYAASGSLSNLTNPVIQKTNPTCPNLLLLAETDTIKPESLSVSTLVVTSTVSQRSRKFMMTVFSLLFMSFLFGLGFIAQYFIDYHLQRTVNAFFPMEIRR